MGLRQQRDMKVTAISLLYELCCLYMCVCVFVLTFEFVVHLPHALCLCCVCSFKIKKKKKPVVKMRKRKRRGRRKIFLAHGSLLVCTFCEHCKGKPAQRSARSEFFFLFFAAKRCTVDLRSYMTLRRSHCHNASPTLSTCLIWSFSLLFLLSGVFYVGLLLDSLFPSHRQSLLSVSFFFLVCLRC